MRTAHIKRDSHLIKQCANDSHAEACRFSEDTTPSSFTTNSMEFGVDEALSVMLTRPLPSEG